MQIYGGEKVIAYGCGVAAEDRRRSLDRIRVMQRPSLRTMMSAAAAVELERQEGCERKEMKKREE